MKIKGWRDIYQVNITKKKAGEVISISDKTDFTIKRYDKYIVPIKDTIGQDARFIINICPSNNMDSKYIKATAKQQEDRYNL